MGNNKVFLAISLIISYQSKREKNTEVKKGKKNLKPIQVLYIIIFHIERFFVVLFIKKNSLQSHHHLPDNDLKKLKTNEPLHKRLTLPCPRTEFDILSQRYSEEHRIPLL